MTYVHQSNHAHNWKTAAWLLAGMLGIDGLIRNGVHERDAGAVEGFDEVTVPLLRTLDTLVERSDQVLVNAFKKVLTEALAGFAVATGVKGWWLDP